LFGSTETRRKDFYSGKIIGICASIVWQFLKKREERLKSAGLTSKNLSAQFWKESSVLCQNGWTTHALGVVQHACGVLFHILLFLTRIFKSFPKYLYFFSYIFLSNKPFFPLTFTPTKQLNNHLTFYTLSIHFHSSNILSFYFLSFQFLFSTKQSIRVAP
jgi:hypothetical protein